jgi:hypothetical protein
MKKEERWRSTQQDLTQPVADRTWRRYGDGNLSLEDEIALILYPEVDMTTIALALGRSYRGVREKRKKLKRRARQLLSELLEGE